MQKIITDLRNATLKIVLIKLSTISMTLMLLPGVIPGFSQHVLLPFLKLFSLLEDIPQIGKCYNTLTQPSIQLYLQLSSLSLV